MREERQQGPIKNKEFGEVRGCEGCVGYVYTCTRGITTVAGISLFSRVLGMRASRDAMNPSEKKFRRVNEMVATAYDKLNAIYDPYDNIESFACEDAFLMQFLLERFQKMFCFMDYVMFYVVAHERVISRWASSREPNVYRGRPAEHLRSLSKTLKSLCRSVCLRATQIQKKLESCGRGSGYLDRHELNVHRDYLEQRRRRFKERLATVLSMLRRIENAASNA